MHMIKEIQHVQNAAARVVTGFPKFCHIAPVLVNLFLRKYGTDLVGQYRIYERGRCPSDLKEGLVRWDDDDVKPSNINDNDKGASLFLTGDMTKYQD